MHARIRQPPVNSRWQHTDPAQLKKQQQKQKHRTETSVRNMAEYVHTCPTQREQAQVKTVAGEKTIYIVYRIHWGALTCGYVRCLLSRSRKCIDSELRNRYFGLVYQLLFFIHVYNYAMRRTSKRIKYDASCKVNIYPTYPTCILKTIIASHKKRENNFERP